MGLYYHCKKTGHLIADYPSLQATTSKKLHKKKKVMVATWDDSEIESDEEDIDTTNVCFMTNEEKSTKVTFKPSLDDDELTIYELAHFFEELFFNQNSFYFVVLQKNELVHTL